MSQEDPIPPSVVRAYQETIHKIMKKRAQFIVLMTCVILMAFSFVDHHLFRPEQEVQILIARIVVSTVLIGLYFLTFLHFFKERIIWISDAGIFVVIAFLCYVVYLTEGASGKYYEGITQGMFIWLIANAFYYKHLLFLGVMSLILYASACLANSAHWDLSKFIYASTMISISALYVSLAAKFYASEFFYGFVRNEALKESEKKLGESNKKLEVLYQRADFMSKIDDLTKIYNRRYFLEILIEKARECKDRNTFFYLVIFDIDNFKEINDTFGHSVGDEVIRMVAQTVVKNLRSNSFIGRYGGDEFMILIDHAEKEVFFKRIEKIKEEISKAKIASGSIKLEKGGKEIGISVSVGAVKVDPKKYENISSIIDLADRALLQVKQTKRGAINLVE